jgi:NAD(P)-dependent dehydrogenase (short-subunit alcohol dehydrogenase family)
MAGDIGSSKHWRAIVDKASAELGGIDILVSNAAHQGCPKIQSKSLGKSVPMKRPGQPAELTTAYVMPKSW